MCNKYGMPKSNLKVIQKLIIDTQKRNEILVVIFIGEDGMMKR